MHSKKVIALSILVLVGLITVPYAYIALMPDVKAARNAYLYDLRGFYAPNIVNKCAHEFKSADFDEGYKRTVSACINLNNANIAILNQDSTVDTDGFVSEMNPELPNKNDAQLMANIKENEAYRNAKHERLVN